MPQHQTSSRSSFVPRTRKRWLVASALAATGALAPTAALAQARVTGLTGRLTDTTGAPALPVPDEFGRLPQDSPDPTRTYAIPEGPLADVLAQLARETGIAIDARAEVVRGLTSPGVNGRFTVAQALAAALQGTSLSSRLTSPVSAIVEVRIDSESVDVTAGLPRVASSRYPTSITETPQTLQVIPRTTIEQQGAFSLGEVLRNVPGITLQGGEGGGASGTAGEAFNMRGFSGNNSMFVDGVRDDGLVTRDTFNMEQVEVFLGPTGTDVGRGTAAGYVNMVTKSPRPSSGYGGSLAFGSHNQVRATADLNQALPLGATGSWLSRSAFRLNALVQGGGVPGRDEVKNERRAVAPSFSLGLGSSTRATVSAPFMRQDNIPDYGIPAAAYPDGPLTPTGVTTARAVSQSNFYGTPANDFDDVSQDSFVARLEHDVTPGLSIRNQARYNATHRQAVISAMTSAAAYNPATDLVTIARQANERENKVFSNQTTVVGRTVHGHVTQQLSGGVEYIRESQFAPTLTGAGTRDAVDIYNPRHDVPVTGFALTRTGAYTDGSTDTIAAFLFDTINFGDAFQVSGGVRVDRYDTTYDSFNATTSELTSIEADGSVWSGKIGALYRLTPLGNVYVSVGRTVTPPGTANFALSTAANNANNPNVDPQISTNLEVGTKWDLFERRLSASLATFLTRNTNVIYTVDATTVPPTFNQDDKQRVRGVAIGLVGRVTDNWDVLLNATFLNSENQSQNTANAGKWLSLTPESSGSIWTTYRTPFKLRVGGGLRYQGDAYINAANTVVLPSSTVVDAMAEYPVMRQLLVRVNIYNLTDEL